MDDKRPPLQKPTNESDRKRVDVLANVCKPDVEHVKIPVWFRPWHVRPPRGK